MSDKHTATGIGELAVQRVEIVERLMKLPYIKATRNASVGEERFVARDDVIGLIHQLAKESRAALAAKPLPDKDGSTTEND